MFTSRLDKFVVDGVDPEKALTAFTPGALELVFALQRFKRPDLLPNTGEILVFEQDQQPSPTMRVFW